MFGWKERYKEVDGPGFAKRRIVEALAREAQRDLGLEYLFVRWFLPDPNGSLETDGPSDGFAWRWTTWLRADLPFRRMCHVLFHEARHARQLDEFPEYMTMKVPLGLYRIREEVAEEYAREADRKFESLISGFGQIAEGRLGFNIERAGWLAEPRPTSLPGRL
jgi:hypothetical protein